MSNTIRFDSVLVHYLARELDERLRARRLRGVRLDSDARRFIMELDEQRLIWELHPTRGWIRMVQDTGAGTVREAVEGWAVRRIQTQRRPRIRRVTAPLDERWMELEIDAGGRDRASRFVIELLTNQWNVLALAPDGTIVGALLARETRERTVRPGVRYVPPGATSTRREGVDAPVEITRWRELLERLPPAERARELVRSVAWTSPLNAGAVLGPAGDPEAGDDPARLDEAWHRYVALASRPAPHPQLLDLGRLAPYPLPLPGVDGRSMLSLLAALDAAASEAPATLAPEIRAALADRLLRVERRAERLREEAEGAPARAALLRHHADLLMAQLHRVEKGATQVILDDFEGGTVTVELDPALAVAENARVLYDRARKRARAATSLPERVREAVAERHRIASLLEAIDAGEADNDDVARWLAEVRPSEGPGASKVHRVPYHRFRSSGGLEIRVGRAGRANDDLTFRHASPDDIWLHARDAAGAHVILRWNDREQNPPQRDLMEAAILAALNSRARTSGTVPVDWTRRKYVRKPRKAPPGAVLPDRVATIFVEPDPSLPDRLTSAD